MKGIKNLIDEDLLEAKQRLAKIIKVVTTGEGEEAQSHIILTKQENLVAVPRLTGIFYYPDRIREGFLKAAQKYKHDEIISTWIDSTGFCVSAEASVEGISDLMNHQDITLWTTATFSGQPEWVYLRFCTDGEDYAIVIGTEEVTQLFTGTSSKQAYGTFSEEVDEMVRKQCHLHPQIRLYDRLVVVKQKIAEYNNSPPGTEIQF